MSLILIPVKPITGSYRISLSPWEMVSSLRTSQAILESILSLSQKVASATDREPHRNELRIAEDANAKPNLEDAWDFVSQRFIL